MCDMTHRPPKSGHERRDLPSRVGTVCVCDMTYSHVCDINYSYVCDVIRWNVCDMTHWYVCDMTHWYVCDMTHTPPPIMSYAMSSALARRYGMCV